MDAFLQNGLTLAYIGDSAYEILVRKHILNKGLTKVKDLHKTATSYTSAHGQSKIVRYLLDNNILTEKELDIYKRGRNSNISHFRKNVDRHEYIEGTGFEALFGYLYLEDETERLNEIFEIAVNVIEREG